MSGIDFDAGVDVEADSTQGLLASVAAKFTVGMESVTKQLARANALEQAKLQNIPNYVTFVQATQTAGTAILDFGEPQPGRQWYIRLLTAFANPLAANAALVTWYIGQNIGSGTPGMLITDQVVWQFPSVPGFKEFSANNITVQPRQHLLAGITGGTGASLVLTARIADLPVYNPLSQVDV